MNFLDIAFHAQAEELNVFHQASLSEISRCRELDTIAMVELASAHEQAFSAMYAATCCVGEVDRSLQDIQLEERQSVLAQVRAGPSFIQENLNEWYEQTQALRNSVAGLTDTWTQTTAASLAAGLRISPDESALSLARQSSPWQDFFISDGSGQSAASVEQFTQFDSFASQCCARSVLQTIGDAPLGYFGLSPLHIARDASPDSRTAIPHHSSDLPDGARDSALKNSQSLLPSKDEEANPRGAAQQAMEGVNDEQLEEVVIKELAALGDGHDADLQAILSGMPQILARVMDKHPGETATLRCLIQNVTRAIGILTAPPGVRTGGRKETLTQMDFEMVQDACADLRVFIRGVKRRNN